MSENDLERAERERELVRAALEGEPAARAVLAQRLRCVPLEVARREALDRDAYALEVRAQLSMALEALHVYDGSPPLEEWLVERVRRSLPVGTPAPDPEALADTIDLDAAVARELGRAERPRPSRRRRLSRSAPLVGVVVLLFLFLWDDPELGPSGSVDAVRGGEVRLTGPVGETASWGVFTWIAEPLPGYTARVVVTGAEGQVLRSPALDEPSWTPTPEQRAALSDRIRWEVIERGGERRGWARAWLPAR